MPLADQIKDLGDRLQSDLGVALDFYEHTKEAWRVAQRFAHAGHAVNIRIVSTGATLIAADLDGLAQRYGAIQKQLPTLRLTSPRSLGRLATVIGRCSWMSPWPG